MLTSILLWNKHGIIKEIKKIDNFQEFFKIEEGKGKGNIEELNSYYEKSSISTFKESETTAQSKNNEESNLKDSNVTSDPDKRWSRESRMGEDNSGFMFPFQRRAKSRSPSPKEEINNKIAEKMSKNSSNDGERSWSNSIERIKETNPVVANIKFMIGGFEFNKKRNGKRSNLNLKGKDVDISVKHKEVDEWFRQSGDDHDNSYVNEKVFDDHEVIDNISSSLSKFGGNQNLCSVSKFKENGGITEKENNMENWMYQSIHNSNEAPTISPKVHNLFNDDKENQSPNFKQKQQHLDNLNIEDFLRNKKLIPQNKKIKR